MLVRRDNDVRLEPRTVIQRENALLRAGGLDVPRGLDMFVDAEVADINVENLFDVHGARLGIRLRMSRW